MKLRYIPPAMILMAVALASPVSAARFKLGVVTGYYAMNDGLYRDLYGSGGMMASGRMAVEFSRAFEVSAEIGFFSDKGVMSVSQEPLTLSLKPFLVGLRVSPLTVGLFRPFVGVGYGSMAYREKYPQRLSDYSGSSGTLSAEAGTFFKLHDHFEVTVGIRYLNATAKAVVANESIKLGGILPSIGISYAFTY